MITFITSENENSQLLLCTDRRSAAFVGSEKCKEQRAKKEKQKKWKNI
jgi:hypothetical protein